MTTVPKSFMKKLVSLLACCKRVKSKTIDEKHGDHVTSEEEIKDENENLDKDVQYIENSNVSWIRGSNRLQNQVFF